MHSFIIDIYLNKNFGKDKQSYIALQSP